MERERRSRLDDAERIEDEIEARNPDPTTKREAFEREAAERGVSDEATDVGDVVDGPDDRDEDSDDTSDDTADDTEG